MSEQKPFIKLKDVQNFTVEKVWGYKWTMWDAENNKMLRSDTYQDGYKKQWDVDCVEGKLGLSGAQFAQLLEASFKDGEAKPVGKTFTVKTNGQQGKDIRYFINLAREQAQHAEAVQDVAKPAPKAEEVTIDGLPF